MATRPKNYQNYVPPADGRKYRITENGDGTVKITDATEYLAVGDPWSAADGNAIWDALEENADELNSVKDNYVPKAGGTMKGALKAFPTEPGAPTVRNIYAGTAEMEAGKTSLETGVLYLMYE